MILAPTCALLFALAPAPAWPGSRLLRRLPRVVILRRPGIRSYERVSEEVAARVRAQIRSLAPEAVPEGELLPWLLRTRPDVVITIGQSAYDHILPKLRKRVPFPLVHCYVFHRASAKHREVPARVPPLPVFRALRAAVPRIRTVGVLASVDSAALLLALSAGGHNAGIRLVPLIARSAPHAIGVLRRKATKLDALWLPTDLRVLSRQVIQYAVGLQFRRRIPLLAASRYHVRLGALMALDYDPAELGLRVAIETNRLLSMPRRRRLRRGRGPALRGPFGPSTARFTVNAAAARHLGIKLDALRALGAEVVH